MGRNIDKKWNSLYLGRRSTKSYEFYFTSNGTTQDITGWTIYFTVKKNMNDDDNASKILKKITTHEDPINGKTVVSLSAEDTDLPKGRYYYSIDYKDADNNEDSLFYGHFEIKEPTLNLRD